VDAMIPGDALGVLCHLDWSDRQATGWRRGCRRGCNRGVRQR
jgi:hypothetical protein